MQAWLQKECYDFCTLLSLTPSSHPTWTNWTTSFGHMLIRIWPDTDLPGYGSGTESMPFPQAPAGARRILGGCRRSGWLWCSGRSCWWCSRRMIKRSSPASLGRRRREASERRVQSRSTPSEANPGSLWTCGPA